MDLVTVRNTGTKPLVLKHDLLGDTTIQPGKDRIVPVKLATSSFGNPAAVNDPRNRLRDVEVSSIYTRWGFYPGMMSDSAWSGVGTEAGTDPPKQIGPLCPQAECYDLDGNRVWMIHDDPTGEHRDSASGATITPSIEARTAVEMQSQIDTLSRQLQAMVNAQGSQVDTTPKATLDGADEGGVEAMLADAMQQVQTQAERNAQRDEIPQPPADAGVSQDKPRTPRTGTRAA